MIECSSSTTRNSYYPYI